MEVIDVVKKLIGPIEPVGETNTDEKRYKNLLEMIELVELLHSEIFDVSSFSGRCEYSLNKAGKRAAQFLKDIKEWYID